MYAFKIVPYAWVFEKNRECTVLDHVRSSGTGLISRIRFVLRFFFFLQLTGQLTLQSGFLFFCFFFQRKRNVSSDISNIPIFTGHIPFLLLSNSFFLVLILRMSKGIYARVGLSIWNFPQWQSLVSLLLWRVGYYWPTFYPVFSSLFSYVRFFLDHGSSWGVVIT